MKRAVLTNVNLSQARLDDADLTDVLRAPPPIFYIDDKSLTEVVAEHEQFCDSAGRQGQVMKLHEVDFRPMKTLKRRRLSGLSAPKSIFFGMDLEGAQLQGADLTACDFRGANLREADLRGARFTGAQLARCDMRGAKMGPLAIGDNRFVRTDFSRASLRGADLRGASAPRARFLEAEMDGARIAGCDLTGAELEI